MSPPSVATPINGVNPESGAVSAAAFGKRIPIPAYLVGLYIKMMGARGLREATQLAILNANYTAKRLEESYSILYRGTNGMVAHECIIDIRPLKAGVRYQRGRYCQAVDGLWLPCAHHVISGAMHTDDRADRVRVAL